MRSPLVIPTDRSDDLDAIVTEYLGSHAHVVDEWDQFNKYSGCVFWHKSGLRGSLNFGVFEYTRNRRDFMYPQFSPAFKQPFRYDRDFAEFPRQTSSTVFRLQWISSR